MGKNKVHIVALSKEVNKTLCHQKEVIQVSKDENYCPFLIILKLKYKGKKYKFALPLRSNIGNAPKETYFPLPNRKSTRTNRKHGLHYIKMFPIDSKYSRKYYFDDTIYGGFIIAYIENSYCEGSTILSW